MIIKPSTAQRNEYGTISDMAHGQDAPIYITKNGGGDLVVMSIEAFERREEVLKPRAKPAAADGSRLSGAPAVSLEESRRRLEAIYEQEVQTGHSAPGAADYPKLLKTNYFSD